MEFLSIQKASEQYHKRLVLQLQLHKLAISDDIAHLYLYNEYPQA